MRERVATWRTTLLRSPLPRPCISIIPLSQTHPEISPSIARSHMRHPTSIARNISTAPQPPEREGASHPAARPQREGRPGDDRPGRTPPDASQWALRSAPGVRRPRMAGTHTRLTCSLPPPPTHTGFEKVPVRLEHAAPASERSQTARAGGVDPPGPGTPAAQRLALRCYRSSGVWPARARDWTRGVGGWVCRVRHMTTPTGLALCFSD